MRSPSRIEIEEFKTILNEEIALYHDLELQLEQKKQILATNDLDALVRIDTEIEKLNERGRELEQKRLASMVRMGQGASTFREFIASLESGEDTLFLERARVQLTRSIEEIRKLSRANVDLLTQSIRFVEQSVETIASILAPESPAYSNPRIGNRSSTEKQLKETCGIPSTICREA